MSKHIRADVLGYALAYEPFGTAKERLINERGGRCEGCGYEYTGFNEHHFDWHHKDPAQKEFSPGQVNNIDRLRPEVEKCLLLCKLCHADEHHTSPRTRALRFAIVQRLRSVPSVNFLGVT